MKAAESLRLKRALDPLLPSLHKHIHFLSQELDDLDKEIDDLINSNSLWKGKLNLLMDVPGIGSVSSFTLVEAPFPNSVPSTVSRSPPLWASLP